MSLSTKKTNITVGARSSDLSRVQSQEVLEELQHYHPEISFNNIWVTTTGDKDLKTSLRELDKTDFFTKELDSNLLNGEYDITIHSAKDLPEPLTEGLTIIALTRGVDSSDVLILPKGITPNQLTSNSIIATSSERREEAVKELCPEVKFCDIRGTIPMRLQGLQEGTIDGLVAAEAAIIRLNLTDLNRFILPGETTPFQGRLAIVAREDDIPMQQLFSSIDTR